MRAMECFKTTGCWARMIARPHQEIQTLAIREFQNGNELQGHDHLGEGNYTRYSPCTYIRDGFGIRLFQSHSSKAFTLLIRPLNRPVDWWYNGRHEIVTDDIQPIPGKKYNNGADKSDQLRNCDFSQIAASVKSLRDEFARDSYYKENPDEPVTMKWNEGFIRHQRKDIIGLAVNVAAPESIIAALAFRKAFQLPVHLYVYDEEYGKCKVLHSSELCRTCKIKPEIIDKVVARYVEIWNRVMDSVTAFKPA